MSQSESAEPEFKSWSYDRARKELWPEEKLKTWKPGDIPPESIRKPIDDEIKKLLAPEKSDSPKVRSAVPVFTGGNIAPLTTGEVFNQFCPFHEVRAHWAPFAVEVARFEEERRLQRSKIGPQTIQYIEGAVRALTRLLEHDEHALAGVDRPLLGSWTAESVAGACSGSGVEQPAERPADEEEAKFVRDAFSVLLAFKIKAQAERTLTLLKENLASNQNERGPLAGRRVDYAEWKISFAGTLGFAWRRLTGRAPSASPSSPFVQFVEAAYLSLGGSPKTSWDHACRLAVERYRSQFDVVDKDPTLFVYAADLWAHINLGPDAQRILGDLDGKDLPVLMGVV